MKWKWQKGRQSRHCLTYIGKRRSIREEAREQGGGKLGCGGSKAWTRRACSSAGASWRDGLDSVAKPRAAGKTRGDDLGGAHGRAELVQRVRWRNRLRPVEEECCGWPRLVSRRRKDAAPS